MPTLTQAWWLLPHLGARWLGSRIASASEASLRTVCCPQARFFIDPVTVHERCTILNLPSPVKCLALPGSWTLDGEYLKRSTVCDVVGGADGHWES